MTNKYKGTCNHCGQHVPAHKGTLEKVNRKWVVYCDQCNFDRMDHSSEEDRCCGDMAYEDACARQCGL